MTAMDYRLYDNALGRFMNIDPLADIDGQIDISPYSFAWNNPVVFNDPSGLCPECNTNVNNPTEGQDYTDSNGLSWIYNGTDWVGQLNEVVINNVPEESTAEKVVDVATDFIPVVGNVKGYIKELEMDYNSQWELVS